MLTDVPRKLLKQLAKRAELQRRITPKMFRHSYCAARLQTLDGGAPVSPHTVGKELGHGGDAMVKRVYGHLGQMQRRGTLVAYVCRTEKAAKLLRRP